MPQEKKNHCSFVIGPMSQLCDCLAEIPQAATAACEKQISVSNSGSEPPVPGIRARLCCYFCVSMSQGFFFSILPAHDIDVYVCVVYAYIHITHMHAHTHNISIKVLEFRQMHRHFRSVFLHILGLYRRI